MKEPDANGAPIPAPMAEEQGDASHTLLHVPVNVRSMALLVLTTLALLATLKWASAFFIPLMLAMASFAALLTHLFLSRSSRSLTIPLTS